MNGGPVLGGGRGDDCMGKYNYVNLFQSILDRYVTNFKEFLVLKIINYKV